MANSGFVVINNADNNGHGNLSSWVFSLFVLIILLVVGAVFIVVHRKATDGQSKVSFHFQSCLLANTALNHSFINLVEPDSSYTRLLVNSVLRINCCQMSLSISQGPS